MVILPCLQHVSGLGPARQLPQGEQLHLRSFPGRARDPQETGTRSLKPVLIFWSYSSIFLFTFISIFQGPRRQLGPSRGRDDSQSTHGTPSPTPAHVASPEPSTGNRNARPEEENRFEAGSRSLRLEHDKTPVNTESVVTAAAPDLKPAAGQAVQVRQSPNLANRK